MMSARGCSIFNSKNAKELRIPSIIQKNAEIENLSMMNA